MTLEAHYALNDSHELIYKFGNRDTRTLEKIRLGQHQQTRRRRLLRHSPAGN